MAHHQKFGRHGNTIIKFKKCFLWKMLKPRKIRHIDSFSFFVYFFILFCRVITCPPAVMKLCFGDNRFIQCLWEDRQLSSDDHAW